MDKQQIIETLKSLHLQLEPFHVTEISLFGSFVRNEQTPASDVDVLVTFDQDASFFDLVRLGFFLEENLGRKVDVIPIESLRAEIRDTVLRERILV